MPSLPSFCMKGTLPKPGRWFAWNQACEEQLAEWPVMAMIFSDAFGPGGLQQASDSPAEKGLSLAWKISCNALLYVRAKLLQVGTRVWWSWCGAQKTGLVLFLDLVRACQGLDLGLRRCDFNPGQQCPGWKSQCPGHVADRIPILNVAARGGILNFIQRL